MLYITLSFIKTLTFHFKKRKYLEHIPPCWISNLTSNVTIFYSLFSSRGIDLVAEHSCQVFTQTFPICKERHGYQNDHIVVIVTKM